MNPDSSQNNINSNLTTKTAFINAIKQYNAGKINEANQNAAEVKANAHQKSAQKLRKAHASASAKVNAAKFEYVYFLNNGNIFASDANGCEEKLQTDLGDEITFSCFTLDPVNQFIYAFQASAPYNLYKFKLDENVFKLTKERVFSLNGEPAIDASWDAEGGYLYWMNAKGNINSINAQSLEVNISLFHRNTYPPGVEPKGNPFLTPDSLYGRATVFNGSSSCIQFPPNMFTQNMEEGTIEACVYLNELQKGTIFAVQDNNVNSMAILTAAYLPNTGGVVAKEEENKIYFKANNEGGQLQSLTTLKPNLWYHIAVTFRKNNITLYVNGKQEDTVNYTFTIPFSTTSLISLGAWLGDGQGQYWNGKLANFKLFNTALTAEEIKIAAQSRIPKTPGVYPNSVIYQENHPETGSVAVGPKSNTLAWSSNGRVWMSDLQGNAVKELSSVNTYYLPMDVAVDDSNGSVYWIDNNNNAIFRHTTANKVNENLCSLEGIAVGLELDSSTGSIYWTQKSKYESNLIPNLVGRWLFGNKVGNTIADISENGYPATIHGEGNLVKSKISGAMGEDTAMALNFDGTSTYCSLPDMNIDYSEGITVESWAQFDALQNFSRIIDFGNGAQSNNIVLYNNATSNNFMGAVFNGSTLLYSMAIGVIKPNEWIHYAFTLNKSGNGKIYINGKLIISQDGFVVPQSINRTTNYIGKSNWENNALFKGKMAEIRIWNCPRTQDQIVDNMGSLQSSVLKTYNSSNKLTHTVCNLSSSRHLALLSKGLTGYDQMLENLHAQSVAHQEAIKDLAMAHQKASQKKQEAQNTYNQNVSDANSKITNAKTEADAKRKAAQGRLNAAQNAANQNISNAQNAANAKKEASQIKANQIKLNAQQKKRNMLDSANAKLAEANRKKAKYS